MVRVTSEIGRLRRVLVHDPGPEVDLMAPGMMEELLFDDILFGDRAREEHAIFRRVLQLLGVEVVEARQLLEETLAVAEARDWLAEVILQDLPSALLAGLREASPAALAATLTVGLRNDPTEEGGSDRLYRLPPLPNWCFQRDPQIVIGDGVAFAAMAAPARHLEAMLARVIFRFHPSLSGVPVLFEPLDAAHHRHLFPDPELPRLEGGDVLVVSPRVLAVGLSERTSRSAVQHLARSLRDAANGPEFLVVIEVPRRRAYMHLDTLITIVDHDACLVHPPVILERGAEQARVWEIELRRDEPNARSCDGLLDALRRHGIDLEPIPCGGRDPLFQQREQWTDGANALAVAPGILLLYDRNVRTAEELAGRGFRVITAEELLLGRQEIDCSRAGRTCVLLPSNELSRARGGPHCLSHPLLRDEA